MTQSIRWLQDEIATRMLQKLDIVKLPVKDLLVMPDFPGAHARFLTKRFSGLRFHSAPEESLSGLKLFQLKAARLWQSRFQSCANISIAEFNKTGRILLPDNSVDLVFSILLLHELTDPKQFLHECWRVIKEGGLLTLSYLGPDTAKELQQALVPPDFEIQALVSPWDMHDMGDALIGEGFSDPVMDMEFLNLSYESNDVFLRDVAALNLLKFPLEHQSNLDLFTEKMTLEVVYGHAWVLGKQLARARDSVAYIDINQIGHKASRVLP